MRRDPTKLSVHHDFPSLPYDAATGWIAALQSTEGECKDAFLSTFNIYVHVWEYGYYFLDRFMRDSKLSGPQTVVPATLFSEGHASLRSTFLTLFHGYPADAIATLRRVHEAFVKACDCAFVPAKTVDVIRASDGSACDSTGSEELREASCTGTSSTALMR